MIISWIANSVSALIAAANGNANATIDDIKSNADIKTDSNTKVPASDKTNTDKNSNNQNKAIKVGGRFLLTILSIRCSEKQATMF